MRSVATALALVSIVLAATTSPPLSARSSRGSAPAGKASERSRPDLQGASAPMTFEEVLAEQERIDDVAIAPNGLRVAVNVVHGGRPTGGAAYPIGQIETRIVDWTGGREVRLSGPFGAMSMQPCDPWSSSGRYLAILAVRDGRLTNGRYDTVTSQTVLAAVPAQTLCGTWVGDDLVFNTLGSTGWVPATDAARLVGRWREAGEGRVLQARVLSTDPAQRSAPELQAGLVVLTAGGASTSIATGLHGTVAVAPDSRRFAVIRFGPASPAALNALRGRVGAVDVYEACANGAFVKIGTIDDVDVDGLSLSWSPDGSKLIYGGARPDGSRMLGVWDTAGRTAKLLPLPRHSSLSMAEPGSNQAFRWTGWVGGAPAYVAQTAETLQAAGGITYQYGTGVSALRLFVTRNGQAEMLAGFSRQSVERFATRGGAALFVADGALWEQMPGAAARRVSRAGLVVLALADERLSRGERVEPFVAGNRIVITSAGSDGGYRRTALDIPTGRLLWSEPADAVRAISADGSYAMSLSHEGWSSALRTSLASSRAVLSTNVTWRSRPVGRVERLKYRVAGRDLVGWLVLPPGYRSGPLPTLVWIYGGQLLANLPDEATPASPGTPVFNGQLWAARGYAVLFPSTPIGRGRDQDIRAQLADAVHAALDAGERAGRIDGGRVGIIGHSFGGYSVASILSSRPERIRAGIAMSGLYDLSASWGHRNFYDLLTGGGGDDLKLETRGYIENGQAGMVDPPWQAPEAYARNSPFFHVASLRTPLLLTVGDIEPPGTDPEQAERFYAALRRAGGTATYVRYWGQGHVQDEPTVVRDQWERSNAWFAHYVRR